LATPAASSAQTAPAQQPAPAQQQTTPADPASQQPGLAQRNAPPADDTYVIKTNVNEVDLFFTVTDKRGNFVTGLKRENFGLLDDGRPPERVFRFQQQTDLPLRVGVMMDTSSSIRQRFHFEQEAATDFFLQVLHRNDRAFVEGFDVQLNLSQGFTNNVDLLDTGIAKLRPGGGTALFDALYTTCKDQMLTLQEEGSVRKAIVMVSDGEDNYSRATEQDAIKMCQRAETLVYTISTDTSPSRGKGSEVLRRIADATGGQAFYPDRMEDVAIGFQKIEKELRSQYSLLYTPAEFKQDGSFRTIYLQSTNGDYHVRAKKGYFAPRPPQ
jgi:VWFA-related protein